MPLRATRRRRLGHPAPVANLTPDDARPHLLVVGGLLAPPVAYRRVRERLLERGAASVDVAPVRAPDWGLAAIRGFGALQATVGQAIRRTRARADGRPVMVVGHSGGGLLARLAMCDAPYRGRVGGMAEHVGCLVTLGSPHDLHLAPLPGTHAGVRLAAFLAGHAPGAWHAPSTAYLTVASDAVRPPPEPCRAPRRGPIARLQHACFRRITGPTLADGSDGIVSLALAHLEGARHLTLHDTLHGVVGSPWYGDAAIIDRWWPSAVDAWRDALDARARGRGPAPDARQA